MATSEKSLVYFVAQSLDGYIAKSDGDISWLEKFGSSTEDFGYSSFYSSIDSLIMGGYTYNQLIQFKNWPYPDKPTWVLSHNTPSNQPEGVKFTTSGPEEILQSIRNSSRKKTWLVGGGKTAAHFLNRSLITDFIVTLIPILLGSGIPLLNSITGHYHLILKEKRVYPQGLVQLHYRLAR